MLLYVVAGGFVNSIGMVKDGLTHRYYGLYWQLIEMLHKDIRKTKAFWYSTTERKLHVVTDGKSLRLDLFRVTLMVLKTALSSADPVMVIIDYPHSFRGFKFFLGYVAFLLLLHLLRKLLRTRFLVICDNMDPPLEHSQALGRSMKTLELLMWTFLNKLVLSFDIVIAMSKGYKVYLARRYGIPLEKIVVIPSGTFVEYIPYTKQTIKENLVIVYAGNLDERLEDLGEKILCTIGELRSEGYSIELIITGKNLVGNLKCLENARFLGGLDFASYLRILSSSHACLLLYPRCIHNDLATFTKFSDCVSAGRMVITTNLLMTSKIVGECSCGLVFANIAEFKRILANVYDQRYSIIEHMGFKARKWAELNSYRVRVEELVKIIKKYLEGGL